MRAADVVDGICFGAPMSHLAARYSRLLPGGESSLAACQERLRVSTRALALAEDALQRSQVALVSSRTTPLQVLHRQHGDQAIVAQTAPAMGSNATSK